MSKIKSLVLRTAGFAIAGSLAIAGQAQAQSVDVNFTGNVGSTCTFGVPTTGVLAPANQGILGLSGLGNFPNVTNTGSAATVTLSCGNGGTLTVGAPVKVTAPAAFTPAVTESFASVNGNNTSASVGARFTTQPTTPIAVPAGVQTVTVGMITGTGGAPGGQLPSGAYNYNVTLTATPQ